MPVKIFMPALSPTMQEGNIVKWLVSEGDKISPGDVIVEIETDKATMEVDAVEAGTLAKILYPAGSENVAVGSLIAILAENGENLESIDNLADAEVNYKKVIDNELINASSIVQSEEVEITKIDLKKDDNITFLSNSKRIIASPLAKRLAQQQNIDLKSIKGSGPNGRVVKSDLINFSLANNYKSNLPNSDHSNSFVDKPNNNIRKIIAKRLLESKQSIPHFYLNIDCNVDKLLEARQEINNRHPETKISVNDLVILATAKALRKIPQANASWHETYIRYYQNVDISVAVAIDDGLITPIIRNADQKSIFTISSEMKNLVKRAKDNKLTPEEFQGGNFSISNLGMYGIKNFNAIINPPQSCILAVGASIKKPVIINEIIKISNIVEVTLSCDHRVVDGAVGAWFLNAFKEYFEHPILMLMKDE